MTTGRIATATLIVSALAVAATPARALEGPAAGAVSATKVKLPDGPGSVRGLSDAASLDVFSGQVAYSVPLDLPKGPAGFGPSLALTYSGELGNGALGIGWSLGEIAIRRTLRHGVPTYGDADDLELTGISDPGRLVRVAANEYRVEGQANRIRVVKRGDRFDVTDADGTRYALGVTASSREEDGARTLAWLAESAVNVVGQQITLKYEKDQGVVYLAELAWGPGGIYRARPIYEGRADLAVSYRAGFLQRWARRLRRVRVEVSGVLARSYELTYYDETSADAGQRFALSRLRGVQVLGSDGLGLPPLTFQYARSELAGAVQVPGVDGWTLNTRGTSFLDVDGDGMTDLVRMELGNHQYRKNQGDHFSDPRLMAGASDVELEAAQLIDLDGDARPELVRVVDDTWRYYQLDAAGNWIARGEWPGTRAVPLHDSGSALADLNGDGRIDVVRAGTGGITVRFGGKDSLGASASLPRISVADAPVEPGQPNVRFHDVNGDGLADVVWLTDEWMKIFLGRGDGTFVVASRIFWPWGAAAFEPADIQIGDLNRDGLVDVVRFSGGHVYWYPGMAAGRLSQSVRHLPRPENASADAVVTIADANGNGSEDVVWSSPRGLWVMDFAGPTTAGMLVQIDNGLGKVTEFSYRSSAALAVAAEDQGQPWAHKLPVAVPIPVRMQVDPGAGAPPRVVHFGVRDGFWDGAERRLGGFLHATQETAAISGLPEILIDESDLLPGLGTDRVLRGKVRLSRRQNGLGDPLITVKTDWEAIPVGGGRAVVRQVESFNAEGVATAIPTRTAFEYDAEARPAVERQLGRLDLNGDEKIIRRSFADDPQTWVRDRAFEQSVFEGDDVTLTSSTRTFFGGPSGAALPLGQVGAGLVRRVDGLLASTRWVTQEQIGYDACGNPVDVMEGGVSRTFSYTPSCLRPTAETVFPNGTAQPGLTWAMAWSYVLDQPVTLTSPDGDVTRIDYDSLARPTAMGINGAVHTHMQYDWTAPRPRTTTWVFDGTLAETAASDQVWPAGSKWRSMVAVMNGAGEELFSSTPLGGGTFVVEGWKERDERGHVILTAEPFYATEPYPAALPTGAARPRAQTIEHDALGRPTRQVLPNGAAKLTTYTAYVREVSSPELAPVRSIFDGAGRIVHTERQVDIELESVDARYDASDRLLGMTLQGGSASPVIHGFVYDTLGRMVAADDPDGGHRDLVFDDGNFLRRHINGAGQSVYFDYDAAGRLARRGDTPTANAATDCVYTYDSAAAAKAPTCRVAGRLVFAKEPAGEVRLCYDVLGRQNGVSRIVSPPGTVVKTAGEDETLSASGLHLGTSFDDGFAVTYRYDRAGRAVAISDGVKDLWRADGLDGAGRVEHETYGSGTTEAFQHDQLGLASRVTVAGPAGGNLFDVLVDRNSYGAPKTITDQDGAGLDHSATFGYDAAGRVSAATLGTAPAQFQFAFRYDGLQNMVLRRVTGPRPIGVLSGVYRYGEPKAGATTRQGPRQLTSIVPEAGP